MSGVIQVGMGEARVAGEGEVLAVLLGSCVALTLLWPAGRRCAVAHCLLPDSGALPWNMGARYVNHALPTLFALMGLRHKDLAQVEAVLAGGANMLGAAGISSGVGTQNIAAAQHCLAQHGLLVAQRDVGGRRGRTVRVDASHYRVAITKVERIFEECDHAGL